MIRHGNAYVAFGSPAFESKVVEVLAGQDAFDVALVFERLAEAGKGNASGAVLKATLQYLDAVAKNLIETVMDEWSQR